MNFPTHIVSAGGIVEDSQGNILLVKTQHNGWVYSGGIISGKDYSRIFYFAHV